MSPRPRLLWVTPSVPDHQGGGDQLRQAFLLDRVAQDFDVHLLGPGPVEDVRVEAALHRHTRVDLPAAAAPSRLGRAIHLLARDPMVVRRAAGWRAALAARLPEATADVDVGIVEHLELARLARRRPRLPWLLTVHLAHSRHFRHLAGTSTGRERAWWSMESRRAARVEAWAGEHHDRLVAMSDEDAGVLRDPVVVPNGVDLRSTPGPVPVDPCVVITGSFDFPPNVDGVTWFLDEVWPDVLAPRPDARLLVVGRRPPRQLRDRLEVTHGATLHADVPEIEPYVDGARVVVVPIRVGAGTRLKALQGLGAGRPVVGTSIGLEGLGLEDGVTARVVDAPATMAAAVTELLADHGRARLLGEAGRAHVEARFGWDAVARPLLNELHRLVGR